MDSSGACYEQFWVWCYFDILSLDSSECPLFSGRQEKAQNNAKNASALMWQDGSKQKKMEKS